MRRLCFLIVAMVACATAFSAEAATVTNHFFSITTLDDSWFLTNDDALRPYGARVDVARVDARGATLELARIDYIEGAFDPLLYLKQQVLSKKDIFCRAATDFSDVYESFIAGQAAQCVNFKKKSNNFNYDCEAMTFNVGYGTFLIIMAHRSGMPSVVARVVDAMTFNIDTKPVTTAADYVKAAGKVVAKHHLPIGNNEHLSGVEMSKDSSTVTLKVTVPYITRESVNVPAFVMTKRDAWFKQAPEALKFNKLLAAITAERKSLRYFYADTRGNEIGTLLILPEEYEQVEAQSRARQQAMEEAKRAQAATQEQQTNGDGAAAQPQEKPANGDGAAAHESAEQPPQAQGQLSQQVNLDSEPKQDAPVFHIVKSGDSLTQIAKQYGVSVSSIKQANPSIKKNRIKIGQKLIIK